MAIGTISTYAVFQSTLTDVSKVETNLTTEQEQLSSGNTSQDFTGMADDTQQYLSLDATIAKTNQYLNDNQVVEARINTTSSALDQVISTATSLQSLISQRAAASSGNAGFQHAASGHMADAGGPAQHPGRRPVYLQRHAHRYAGRSIPHDFPTLHAAGHARRQLLPGQHAGHDSARQRQHHPDL